MSTHRPAWLSLCPHRLCGTVSLCRPVDGGLTHTERSPPPLIGVELSLGGSHTPNDLRGSPHKHTLTAVSPPH